MSTKSLILSAAALTLATGCLLAGPATAAAPPAAQSAGVQVMTRGVELGRANLVTVKNPAAAEAIGLSGVNAGDQVEVTKVADGKWLVKDPRTNRTVTLDKAPNLGQ
jgi:hypothetical protein